MAHASWPHLKHLGGIPDASIVLIDGKQPRGSSRKRLRGFWALQPIIHGAGHFHAEDVDLELEHSTELVSMHGISVLGNQKMEAIQCRANRLSSSFSVLPPFMQESTA